MMCGRWGGGPRSEDHPSADSPSVDGWSGKVLLVTFGGGDDWRWDAMKDKLLSDVQGQEW